MENLKPNLDFDKETTHYKSSPFIYNPYDWIMNNTSNPKGFIKCVFAFYQVQYHPSSIAVYFGISKTKFMSIYSDRKTIVLRKFIAQQYLIPQNLRNHE